MVGRWETPLLLLTAWKTLRDLEHSPRRQRFAAGLHDQRQLGMVSEDHAGRPRVLCVQQRGNISAAAQSRWDVDASRDSAADARWEDAFSDAFSLAGWQAIRGRSGPARGLGQSRRRL